MVRWLERVGIVIVSLAIAVGVIALLSGGLAGGRDDPGIDAGGTGHGLGTTYRDQGDTHLTAGARAPRYDSDPPSSGAYTPSTITAENQRITDNQLLTALALGNVLFLYSTPQPPSGLQAIADDVAPPFTPALAAAGQAVILARRPGLSQVTAVAWTRILRSDSGEELRDFAGDWLGKGAGGRTRTIVGSN